MDGADTGSQPSGVVGSLGLASQAEDCSPVTRCLGIVDTLETVRVPYTKTRGICLKTVGY